MGRRLGVWGCVLLLAGSVMTTQAAPAEQATCPVVMTLDPDGLVHWRCQDAPPSSTVLPSATATITPPATATGLPTGTATPAPSGFVNGIYEDGGLYDPDDADSRAAFTAMLVDIKGRGFTALMVGRSDMQHNAKLLTLADQVGGITVYIGAPQEILQDRCCWNYIIPEGDPNGAPDFERAIAYARGLAGELRYWFESHPSFGGYYLYDEPDTDYGADQHHPSMAATLAQALNEQDPGHVRFITNNAVDGRINVYDRDQMSPFVVDPYPFNASTPHCDIVSPQGPFAGFNLNQFYDELLSRSGKKPETPLWVIGQTHGGGETGLRQPDAEEVRAQYRVAREKGAAAIFWFTYSSQQGWTGLKDNPTLMAAVQALAQGQTGGTSCGGTSTTTPVSTATSTSTASPVPVTGNGVPSVPLNYSETVDQFWSRHPANAQATGYVANLPTQGPVINVAGNSDPLALLDLQPIIDTQCPQSGCTLMLGDGFYKPVHLVGRSNVHFRGVHRDKARLQAVTVANCAGGIDVGGGGTGSYTALNEGLANYEANNAVDQWAIDCFTNRNGNISFKNLTFDGLWFDASQNGGEGEWMRRPVDWNDSDHRVNWAALWIRTMKDVWIEDVNVTNYADGSSVHDGAIGGNGRVDNLLLRRVHFDSFLDRGPSTYAFFDGCHGCGVLDSEMGFSRAGAVTYFVNDDFTEDVFPQDGQWTPNELRLANYVVLRGNVIHGEQQSHAFAVQGAHALIENNTTEQWSTDFALFQTRQPFNHPAGTYTYHHVGHIVRNNQIHGSFSYTRFDAPDFCDSTPADQCWYAGDITVIGNHMTAKDRLLDQLLLSAGNVFPSEWRAWQNGYILHPPTVISGNN